MILLDTNVLGRMTESGHDPNQACARPLLEAALSFVVSP
jgi:hypothetical protein